MQLLRDIAGRRPILFVVALAIFQPLLAIPFVVAFKVAGADLVPLQLIIPTLQSFFILWLIWALGWTRKSGLTGSVRNIHVLLVPLVVAYVPVLLYGTIQIAWGPLVFYILALVATGVSEEGFARGIAIPALLRYGKWNAVLLAAAIFSAGHITNAFFEDFSALQWIDKFGATFGFAILYGAVFLKTGNLWPLIVLHTIHDISYITSGTAGPYTVEPIDTGLHMALSAIYAAYGLYVMTTVDFGEEQASSGAGA